MAVRRSTSQIESDRNRIVAFVQDSGWATRPPEWASQSDIAALVREGRIEKTVKKEWDRQTGYANNFFGGAGVMLRHRAYLSIPDVVTA